ncbi:MAG: glycosyltransferase family 2 protein [Candidatus Nealsonbacteria bacterium]|nr:glycosyltransferase family 2 protein [Candidatus Nealsonbacteria bacterium]
MRILAIIPAYNEEKNIEGVINDVKKEEPGIDVLVIDDGSVDQTALLAGKTKKATVVSLPYNLGIGGAVQTGFKYAESYGYDIVIKVDGDGQHKAEEIKKILQPVLGGQADVAIGSRFLRGNKSYPIFVRRIGQQVISFLTSLVVGQKITDATSGFRCYSKLAVLWLNRYYPADYPEPEEIIFLKKNKFRIKEVWVVMRNRLGGSSSLTTLKSFYFMIKVTLSILINFLRTPVIKKDVQ